jgi:hypothetical protein
MKQVIMGTILALGLGIGPVLAESTKAGETPDAARKDVTIHAPTNRVGAAVPPMKAPDDAAKSKGETMHAPTNRLDKEVPNMTGPDGTQPQ